MLETKKSVWNGDKATGKGSGLRMSLSCQDQLWEQNDHGAIPVDPNARCAENGPVVSSVTACPSVWFPWSWPGKGSLWDLQAEGGSSHCSLKVSVDGTVDGIADTPSGRHLVFGLLHTCSFFLFWTTCSPRPSPEGHKLFPDLSSSLSDLLPCGRLSALGSCDSGPDHVCPAPGHWSVLPL